MPIDWSKYGVEDKSKKKRNNITSVDFTPYLPKPEPTRRELANQGVLPPIDLNQSPVIQAAKQFANPTIPQGETVTFDVTAHPRLLDQGTNIINPNKLLPPSATAPEPETPKQNVVSGPIAETLLYGVQGITKGSGIRALGQLTPSIDFNVPEFTPQQAKSISPGLARGAEIVGELAGAIPGYEGLAATAGRAATRGLVRSGVGKLGQVLGREGATGAAFEATNQAADMMGDTNNDGFQTPAERLRQIAEGGLINAALGGAFHGAVAGGQRAANALRDQQAIRQSVNNFISRVNAPRKEGEFVPFPQERTVQQAGGSAPQTGKQFADNFNRGQQFQKEYEQAVQDQYDFLKKSLNNRGGVDQGGVIRDPVTGEVVDRYGRISNNPPWYQEFYNQNGRAPTDAELRSIAEQQVKQGFQDTYGNIPAWKPQMIQDIDNQIADIQEALPHMQGEIKSGLQQELGRLTKQRQELTSVLPEGVQAMKVGKSDSVQRSQAKPEPAPKTYPATSAELNMTNLPDVPQRASQKSDVKPISRTEVIQNLKNNLGVVIDTGRLGTADRNVLGIFKPRSEVVRSRAMHDVTTIAHEVGHALEKQFKLVNPQFEREFQNVLKNHSNIDIGAYDPSELMDEGFAEYMRLFLTEPETAAKAAPNFTAYLRSRLPEQTLKALESSQEDISRWLHQGGLQSAMGKIDFESGKTSRKFSVQRFYTKTFDDLNPIRLAMNAIYGKMAHLSKSAEENVYKMARLSRGTAERAKLAVSDGIYNENGMKLTDGLGTIVKDLEGIGVTEKELSTYLAVLHAQDLKALGKKVPFTDDEIKAVLDELDSKAMRNIQQKIVKYNNALLDLLTESGILSRQAVEEMRKMYPNYVPFMRLFDDDLKEGFTTGGFGNSKGFANLTNPIKRMSEEGSERTLIDPLQSMVQNTFAVMNAAAKNRVGLGLLDLAQQEGAGRILEIVPGGGSAKEHVVTVKVDGKNVGIKVRDPDLYDAILSLDKETANTLIRFLGSITSVLRGGATLTPEFIVRNAFRDVFSAMVNVGFNPVNFARGLFYAITPSLRRMGINANNRVYEQFISSGGAMSTLFGSSRDYSREAMREAVRKSLKQKAMNVVTNPIQLLKVWRPAVWLLKALRAGAEISEFSTKLGKFKSELNRGASPLEAAFQARDLMDFNRAGSTIRSANQLIAFLNANLQGTDKMIREFNKDKFRFALRGVLTLTMPTIALHYWYANMPEEQKRAYQNIPNYQKDLFFIIPGPNNTFIRIPKPFEAGLIFSSSVDRVLRDFMEHDPAAYKEYFANLLGTFTPPVMIQAVNPILESLSNYSFFRKAPIVPMSLSGEQKQYQYDTYTSETAKLLGKGLSYVPGINNTPFASPKIIDNLISGYTAGLGRYGTAGLDQLINFAKGGGDNPKPAKNLEQNPFTAPFMANAQGSGQLLNDFYDKYEELTSARKSAQSHPEVKYDSKAYARFHQAYNQMSKLNSKHKEILNDPNLTPEEKRDKLNVIEQQRNDLAYQTLYGKVNP